MTKAVLIVVTLLTAGCNRESRSLVIPTAPSAAAPQPPPTSQPPSPWPAPPAVADFTRIEVGQTIDQVIGDAPPDCIGEHGWPCQYFRVIVPNSGTLTVELRYGRETQPTMSYGLQGVDITLESPNRQVWAQMSTPTSTVLTAPVVSGEQYQIVLWYTFPELEYSLSTALR